MRYNAFFGELPINAFKPIGGKMTLHGGGNPISAVTDAISDLGSGLEDVVRDIGSGAEDIVRDVGSSVDDFVNDTIPGGWTTVALMAAGAYYAPEIGAWIGSDGAALATAEEVAAADAAAGAVATPVTQGAVTGTSLGELGAVTSPVSSGAVTGTSLGQLGAAEAAGTGGSALSGGEALSGIDLGGVGASPNSLAGAGAYNAVPTAIGSTVPAAAGSSLNSMLPYMAGGQAVTGLLQADAAKKAADIQSAAAQNATALQGQMFNTINQQQAPYRGAGYGALNDIGSLGSGTYEMYDAAGNPTGVGTGSGYLTHQFDATDLQKGLAPNYDFMLQQGQMANQRAANMGGGALGGNALQGLNKYTQDYAGNAYQNAFTNYQNQRSNIYNTLAGIAGIGQTGQTATNTAAQNATNAATQLGVGSAAAQAAGQVGSANAMANTVGNIGNTYMLSQLLNQSGRVA